jgi:hypothetical protein
MNRTKFWHEKLTLQNGQINIGSICTQEASSFLSVCCKSQDKENIFVVVGNELDLFSVWYS